jgi:hypothetical protein
VPQKFCDYHLAQKIQNPCACADQPSVMAPLNIMESNLPLPRDQKILHTSIEMSGKTKAAFNQMAALSTGSPQKSL